MKKYSYTFIIHCIILALLLNQVTPVFSIEALTSFEDVASMSNEDFFGKWDQMHDRWTTEGKLDYSYKVNDNPVLAEVESCVKEGNYTDAKEALKNYFKNRSTPGVYSIPDDAGYAATADLISRNIFDAGSKEVYISSFDVDAETYQEYSINVTDTVKKAISGNLPVSFILVTADKEDSSAEFYSKDNEDTGHRPVLQIKTGNDTQTVPASKDTTVKAGSDQGKNFGNDSLLYVNGGNPVSDYTCRSYLQFNLPTLSTTPDVITLSLYGKAASVKEIMLFQCTNTAWAEDSLTFAGDAATGNTGINSMLYSWKDDPNGCDWSEPAGADTEWLANLTRFQFVNALITESRKPGNSEKAYDYHLIQTMLDFIQDESASYPRSLDAAMRVPNFITAFHNMKSSDYMNGEACTAILKSLWQHGNYLSSGQDAFHPTTNWGITETLGLYWLALYFPEFKEASSWEALIGKRCKDLFEYLVNDDYSFKEASTHYAGVSIKDFDAIRKLAEFQGHPLPETYNSYMEGLAQYFVDSCYPDDQQTLYGDSDSVERRSTIKPIGKLYNNPSLIYYAASTPKPDTAPPVSSVLYPTGSIAMLRTGMSSDSLYMHINNRNLGNHGHPSALSVMAYAYGRPLLVGPGRGDYSGSPITNWLTGRTQANNTIEIDSKAQDMNYIGHSSLVTNAGFDLYEGTPTKNLDFAHTRHVLFIKPFFWLVSDKVTAPEGSHQYEQTWHLLPGSGVSLDTNAENTSGTKEAVSHFASGANIHIVPADPDHLTAGLKNGYYSPKYGTVNEAVYVSYLQHTAGTVTFDTLLYPTAQDQNIHPAVDRLDTDVDDSATATALKIRTDNSGSAGYYYLSQEDDPTSERSFGDTGSSFSFNGKMAYIDTNADHSIKMACMVQGTELKDEKQQLTLIAASQPIADLQVSWQQDGLHLQSSSLKNVKQPVEITVYEPGTGDTATVYLNDKPAAFIRTGDYVSIPVNQPVLKQDDSTVTAAVTYTRATQSDPSRPVLMVAFYSQSGNAQKLVNTKFIRPDHDLAVGESAPLMLDVPIPENTAVIKTFLWKSMSNMSPIDKILTLTVN